MLGKIELYQAKSNKWRWRFYERDSRREKWDIVAVCTDEYATREIAEMHARQVVVCSWEVEVDRVVEQLAPSRSKWHIILTKLLSLLGIKVER